MGDRSRIEWTEATWNPVAGCSKVSPGCAHCYAEQISLRFGRSAGPWTPANAAKNVVLHPARLDQPLRWRRPRVVFVNSMSDLFHEQIPDVYIAQVFGVMAAAPHHTFQVLTKRPERMRALLDQSPGADFWCAVWAHAARLADEGPAAARVLEDRFVLDNVWVGVSIENRRFVARADELRRTPAAVRFISAEPLLGPLVHDAYDGAHGRGSVWSDCESWPGADDGYNGPELDLRRIDWLIAGGESGPRHRPMRHEWARDLRDACSAAGTAFFMKQLSGRHPGAALEQLPADLRVRELPNTPDREEIRAGA